jgi:hypothetical protein
VTGFDAGGVRLDLARFNFQVPTELSISVAATFSIVSFPMAIFRPPQPGVYSWEMAKTRGSGGSWKIREVLE